MIEKEVGFIPEFRDFITEHIPTSQSWAESIAISILSTVASNQKFVRSKIGHLNLNVWFLMVGPSGLAYKSTPLNYFVYPLLISLTDRLKYSTILPSRFSLEGMIEYLSSYCSQGCIVRDEFTTVFKESSKDYLSDNLEFLSELYDGTVQKRFTRKTKLEQATNVYVTFLAATTPYLYRIMKPDFFVQGTGNRILYVLYPGIPESELDDSPEEFFYDMRQDRLREEKLFSFSDSLVGVYNTSISQFVPEPEAGKLWLDFRKQILLEAKQRYSVSSRDLHYTYMVRLPEFTLKLSALHQLSQRYKNVGESHLTELVIQPDDMEWAINRTKSYYSFFNQLLNDWRTATEPEEPRDLGDAINIVHNILLDFPKGVTWSKFRSRVTWTRYSLSDILSALSDQERVIFCEGHSTVEGGRKSTLLFAKEFENNTNNYEKISWERFAYRTHLEK